MPKKIKVPKFSLSQSNADALMKMEKHSLVTNTLNFPHNGGTLELDFASYDKSEEFVIHYTIDSINISKRNHHFQTESAIWLARLDLDGPPHLNPDGELICPRHLHIYREKYDLNWAQKVPKSIFKNLDDGYKTLFDFMKYCNVVAYPKIT